MNHQPLRHRLVLIFALALQVIACRAKDASRLEGHFSNLEKNQLVAFKNRQVPIPEYDPSSGVVLGASILDELDALDLVRKLAKSNIRQVVFSYPKQDHAATSKLEELAARLRREGLEGKVALSFIPLGFKAKHTHWIRDYGPTILRSKDTHEGVVADFNYMPDRVLDDQFNESFAHAAKVKRFQLPLYFEGGNFLAVRRGDELHCLMTDQVVLMNSFTQIKSDEVFDQASIELIFKRYLGCDRTIIMPRMPYESTGHIDMWAKALSDSTLLVARLDANSHTYSNEPDKVKAIRTYLDKQAEALSRRGYRTVRVPMPSPIFASDKRLPIDLFRSYTNSLLLNGHAYVPRYRKPAANLAKRGMTAYYDELLMPKYEVVVEALYNSLGYQVHWVDSDRLIAFGGAVHCSTMQIPEMKGTIGQPLESVTGTSVY